MAQEPLIVRPPHAPFDDGTITRAGKKAAMSGGIDRPINYCPQHRRSARGIVAGVVIGVCVWALIGGIGLMVWRMYGL